MSKDLGALIKSARQRLQIPARVIAEACGINPAAVYQWEKGNTEPTYTNLRITAGLLKLDVGEMLQAAEGEELEQVHHVEPNRETVVTADFKHDPDAPPFKLIRGYTLDVIVYGTAVGGEEADFSLNGMEVERVLRPPGLLNTKDIFAIRLTNVSMYPAWKDGSLLYVNPNRKPLIGDDAIIELFPTEPGEAGKAYFKRLKAKKATRYVFEQFNPPKEIEFEARLVRNLFRVVPREEELGIS